MAVCRVIAVAHLVVLAAALPRLSGQDKRVQSKPATDAFGDSLPDGVLYRLGTKRMRHGSTNALIFSADGRQLLSFGHAPGEVKRTTSGVVYQELKPSLRLWDIATGELLKQKALDASEKSVIAAPNDQYLAAIAYGGEVLLLDKRTLGKIAEWKTDPLCVAVAFSSDSKALIGLAPKRISTKSAYQQTPPPPGPPPPMKALPPEFGGPPEGNRDGATIFRWDVASRRQVSAKVLADVPDMADGEEPGGWELSPDGSVAGRASWRYKDDKFLGARCLFWDTTKCKTCRTPFDAPYFLQRLCWSPDGRSLALIGPNRDIEVWDTIRGVRTSNGPKLPKSRLGDEEEWQILHMAFLPQAKRIALLGTPELALCDLENGKQIWKKEAQFTDHNAFVAFSRDGAKLAIASPTGVITMMDAATGAPAGFSRTDPGEFGSGRFPSVQRRPPFLLGGKAFLVSHASGVSQRDTMTGEAIRSFADAELLGVSPDGDAIALGTASGGARYRLQIIAAESGKMLWQREWKDGTLAGVAFGRDGKTISVWYQPDEGREAMELLDSATGRRIGLATPIPEPPRMPCPLPPLYSGFSPAVASLTDMNTALVVPGRGKTLQTWDLASGKQVKEWKLPDNARFERLEFVAGRIIAGVPGLQGSLPAVKGPDEAEATHSTYIFDASTGKIQHRFVEPFVTASTDGRWIGLETKGGIQIRNMETGRVHATLSCFQAFGFSPDGRYFAGGKANELTIWETATGRQMRSWRDTAQGFGNAWFSPDGRVLIVSTAYDGMVCAYGLSGLGR